MASTFYQIAYDADTFERLWNWVRERTPGVDLKNPVAYAERDGRVVGVLGTVPTEYGVVAGPLFVDVGEGRNRGFVAVSLVEVYEALLRQIGIERYDFFLGQETSGLAKIPERVGYQVYAIDGDKTWYKKELN